MAGVPVGIRKTNHDLTVPAGLPDIRVCAGVAPFYSIMNTGLVTNGVSAPLTVPSSGQTRSLVRCWSAGLDLVRGI